jgi:F0F1-type ATP synthase epsilon subunit
MKNQQKVRRIVIKTDTTQKFLQIFNGILELTDTELKVLAEFIDSSETVNLCSPANKKKISEKLGIKDHNTLNNYVKRLKDKGAITQTKNGYELAAILKREPVELHILPV